MQKSGKFFWEILPKTIVGLGVAMFVSAAFGAGGKECQYFEWLYIGGRDVRADYCDMGDESWIQVSCGNDWECIDWFNNAGSDRYDVGMRELICDYPEMSLCDAARTMGGNIAAECADSCFVVDDNVCETILMLYKNCAYLQNYHTYAGDHLDCAKNTVTGNTTRWIRSVCSSIYGPSGNTYTSNVCPEVLRNNLSSFAGELCVFDDPYTMAQNLGYDCSGWGFDDYDNGFGECVICDTGGYLDPANASGWGNPNCAPCPTTGGIQGSTSGDIINGVITNCFIPRNQPLTDELGTYTFTSDCYYSK